MCRSRRGKVQRETNWAKENVRLETFPKPSQIFSSRHFHVLFFYLTLRLSVVSLAVLSHPRVIPHFMAEPKTLKVVVLGDLGVGKTCLRSQFVHNIFTNAYKATIGADFLTAPVTLNDKPDVKITLQIWDTAGQERFNSLSQTFYRGTDVAVLVYDVTNYESVLSIPDWCSRFLEHCHVDRPGLVIVGNKIDKVAERCIDKDEVPAILRRNSPFTLPTFFDWDANFMEISCRSLRDVKRVFERVAIEGLMLSPSQSSRASIRDLYIDIAAPSSSCAC